jgi:hypothetical protein
VTRLLAAAGMIESVSTALGIDTTGEGLIVPAAEVGIPAAYSMDLRIRVVKTVHAF